MVLRNTEVEVAGEAAPRALATDPAGSSGDRRDQASGGGEVGDDDDLLAWRKLVMPPALVLRHAHATTTPRPFRTWGRSFAIGDQPARSREL